MANASDNYGLILPVDGEFIEINDLNYNFEKIDNVMWDNRRISVAMYNTARTYNTGSLAGHEDANGHIHAYRCLADNVTGTWDATKWTLTDLASEIEDIRENAGTEVEANPSGTATDTLEKLRVNSTIYAIPEEVVSKEAEGNPIEITDGASAPLVKCETAITGSQDLHGYDKPWVGGAGKNKAKPSYTGNVIGMTVTEVKDSGNNILAYQFTGTSTGRAGVIVFDFPISNQEKEYRIVRSDVHVDAKTFVWNSTTSSSVPFPNNLVTVPANNVVNLSVVIETGTTLTNATIKFMIIDSAEVDTTFAPYANICPITAYTEGEIVERGKNLFDKNANDVAVGYYLVASTGVLTPSQSGYNTSGYIPIEPNTDYTKSGASVAADEYCFYDSTKTFISGLSRTDTTVLSPNNAAYMRFDYKASETDNIQIEKGSTATPYEPYTSTTHTTSYPSAIYRGSEDVVNGSVEAEWIKGKLSDFTFTKGQRNRANTGTIFYVQTSVAKRNSNIICSCMKTINEISPWESMDVATCFLSTPSVGNPYLVICLDYSDVTSMMSDVGNEDIGYELATPTTTPVTPTDLPIKSLNGYSHIESSTGEMEIEYITSKYSPITEVASRQISAVEKLLELMITINREAEMKATKNYTAGDLLIVSGKLYKASSNIANGSTLVINSNVTSTTIAAELAALA